MFAPVINQIGPALIERGYSNAADLQLRGAQAMASGISQAGNSVGNAVAQAAAKWQQEARQADSNAGVLSTYHQMNEQAKRDSGSGIMPDSFFDALANTKNKDQQSGMLMAAAPNFDSYISQQRQIAVAQAAQRDQFQPQIVDVGDSGRQAFLQSRGSAQLLPDGTEADKSRPKIMVTEHGIAVIDPSTGAASLVKDASGNPVMPMPKAGANKGIDPVAILASDDFKKKLDPVNDRIIDLSAKVVSGNKYWGPDWLPAMGRTTYADQLRAEQVRRDALMQTAPAGYNAAVPACPAAPAGDTHSEGDTATNPQTGARMVYQSGNWVAAGTSGGGVDRASALKAAQDAIANGADPAAVNARLQKLGFR